MHLAVYWCRCFNKKKYFVVCWYYCSLSLTTFTICTAFKSTAHYVPVLLPFKYVLYIPVLYHSNTVRAKDIKNIKDFWNVYCLGSRFSLTPQLIHFYFVFSLFLNWLLLLLFLCSMIISPQNSVTVLPHIIFHYIIMWQRKSPLIASTIK